MPYSPKCVEVEFCELRIDGVLRSSGASFVLRSTYIPLTQGYVRAVTSGGAE
jgi:hypothetical protein